MMTLFKLAIVVSQCHFDDGFTFHVEERDGALFLSVSFEGWHGRKWFISKYSTKSEVVQTLLKAILCYFEHEVREAFTYRGRAIFNPHFNVDDLVAVFDSGSEDKRAN